MARGYPDFFGFSIYPQKGIMYREEINEKGIIPARSALVLTINTKGCLFGGWMRVEGQTDLTLNGCDFIVPGIIASIENFDDLRDRMIWENESYPAYMVKYDTVEGVVGFIFSKNVSFALTFSIYVKNGQAAGNIDAVGEIYYFKLQ